MIPQFSPDHSFLVNVHLITVKDELNVDKREKCLITITQIEIAFYYTSTHNMQMKRQSSEIFIQQFLN